MLNSIAGGVRYQIRRSMVTLLNLVIGRPKTILLWQESDTIIEPILVSAIVMALKALGCD